MPSTICFLDLDRTLFDSHQLFLDAQNFFHGLFGVDEVMWAESYAAVRKAGLYSIDAHVKEIQARLHRTHRKTPPRSIAEDTPASSLRGLAGIDSHRGGMSFAMGSTFTATAAAEKFYHTFTDLKHYLYPDAVPFLENAKAHGFAVCLLSYGDPTFQRYKVTASRIADYFDDFFYTSREGAKYVHIEEATSLYSRIMYVDDSVKELDAAKRAVDSCETYFIHRLPGVHDASIAAKHKICHTLAEVFSI